MEITLSLANCGPSAACANGPVTLTLEPMTIGLFCCEPPFDPGYAISPCDTVSWEFGDGTTQTLSGTDRVTHDYALPGNYTMRATVTNAMGSVTVVYGTCCSISGRPPASSAGSNGAVIATSPSLLSFVSNGKSTGLGFDCTGCIVVREDNGPLTITVLRTLDLSRSISTEAVISANSMAKSIRTPLFFYPGETAKSFTISIVNDDVWAGPTRWSYLTFENTTGGTLTAANSSVGLYPGVLIVEDDPRPTLSIEPTVVVLEGDGLTTLSVPYHLSAPMGVACFPFVSYDVAALSGYFETIDDGRIEAGQISGVVRARIRGNTLPEPDRSFELRLIHEAKDGPRFGVAVSTVTILNDDAALYPQQTTAALNTPARLTLDIGSPYPTAVTVPLTSSAPNIASAPASVTIPAGATTVTFVATPHAEGRVQISAVVPARTTQPATITVPAAARRRAAAH